MQQGVASVTTAGTAVPLVNKATATRPTQRFAARVTITAIATNAGSIYVGDADVSGPLFNNVYGTALAAGQSFTIGGGETHGNLAVDLAYIYIDADNNGEGVHFYVEQI